MNEQQKIEEYNYSVFEGKEDFLGFRSVLPVGSPAPDFSATLLETGEAVKLSDYWKKQDIMQHWMSEGKVPGRMEG